MCNNVNIHSVSYCYLSRSKGYFKGYNYFLKANYNSLTIKDNCVLLLNLSDHVSHSY